MYTTTATEKQVQQLELLALKYLSYFDHINISVKIKLCKVFNLPPMQRAKGFYA